MNKHACTAEAAAQAGRSGTGAVLLAAPNCRCTPQPPHLHPHPQIIQWKVGQASVNLPTQTHTPRYHFYLQIMRLNVGQASVMNCCRCSPRSQSPNFTHMGSWRRSREASASASRSCSARTTAAKRARRSLRAAAGDESRDGGGCKPKQRRRPGLLWLPAPWSTATLSKHPLLGQALKSTHRRSAPPR